MSLRVDECPKFFASWRQATVCRRHRDILSTVWEILRWRTGCWWTGKSASGSSMRYCTPSRSTAPSSAFSGSEFHKLRVGRPAREFPAPGVPESAGQDHHTSVTSGVSSASEESCAASARSWLGHSPGAAHKFCCPAIPQRDRSGLSVLATHPHGRRLPPASAHGQARYVAATGPCRRCQWR